MDRQMDRRMDGRDCITSLANAVGNQHVQHAHRQIDRQTDHATASVTIGHIYAIQAMWPETSRYCKPHDDLS